MKKQAIFVLSLVFLFLAMSVVASASDAWPNWWKSKSKFQEHGSTTPGQGQGYSVAEPAAIILLGAGLVSLGIYARKKRKK